MIIQTIPVIIPPIYLPILDKVAASRGNLHARQTISSKEIVMDLACSDARVLRDPAVVNHMDTYGTIPRDENTSIITLILTYPVCIGGGTYVSPTRTGSQKIISPRGPIGPVEVRNVQPFHTSISGNSYGHEDPAPNFSKVISFELSNNSSVDV